MQNRARIRFLTAVFRLICGKYTDFRIDVSLFAHGRVFVKKLFFVGYSVQNAFQYLPFNGTVTGAVRTRWGTGESIKNNEWRRGSRQNPDRWNRYKREKSKGTTVYRSRCEGALEYTTLILIDACSRAEGLARFDSWRAIAVARSSLAFDRIPPFRRSPFPPAPIISSLSLFSSPPLLDNSKKESTGQEAFSLFRRGGRAVNGIQSWEQSYRLIARQFQSRLQSLFPINPCLRRDERTDGCSIVSIFSTGRKKKRKKKGKEKEKDSNLTEKVGLPSNRPQLAARGVIALVSPSWESETKGGGGGGVSCRGEKPSCTVVGNRAERIEERR